MRYRTVVYAGLPHEADRDAELGGHRVPSGTVLMVNVYGIHKDPRFWDTPEVFLPERFLSQPNGSPAAAPSSPAYLPFGAGHRRCAGAGLAEVIVWLFVTRMLRRLSFRTSEGLLSEDEVLGTYLQPKSYALLATRHKAFT